MALKGEGGKAVALSSGVEPGQGSLASGGLCGPVCRRPDPEWAGRLGSGEREPALLARCIVGQQDSHYVPERGGGVSTPQQQQQQQSGVGAMSHDHWSDGKETGPESWTLLGTFLTKHEVRIPHLHCFPNEEILAVADGYQLRYLMWWDEREVSRGPTFEHAARCSLVVHVVGTCGGRYTGLVY
ncbi:hypothetical protein EYF80_029441 [Liparis tanakae]|uniref:Uncharacterized protein n=1 Tax=Liparis tanakae TaxID=230148 RepID=A0A4Z2H4I0_9TELE|nr:hypothetical protein EYF80_029441 [Liparis tanakae]